LRLRFNLPADESGRDWVFCVKLALSLQRQYPKTKKVTIHPCESNINQGLPQIAQIPQILIHSVLSIFTIQTIEDLYQSVIIGEIYGKKAF
jgi:hypothetical protein